MIDTTKLLIGCLIFILGQAISWFQLNSQYMWEWWQDKPLAATIIFGLPCGLSFWYAWNFTTAAMGGSVWSARFVSFGISYLVFPFLTYFLLGESMLTFKTLSCIALSILIIYIQVFA